MSVHSSSTGSATAHFRDRILAERHRAAVDSAARRLALELNASGCPAPRAELARRCHVDHWSQATLDEAVTAAERAGLIRALPMGWVAPVGFLGVGDRPSLADRNRAVARFRRPPIRSRKAP